MFANRVTSQRISSVCLALLLAACGEHVSDREVHTRQGAILVDGKWENGVKHGAWSIRSASDGHLLKHGEYTSDRKTGMWSGYDGEGRLQSETPYVDGLVHGTYHLYAPDGTELKRVEYEQGKMHGVFEEFQKNGKPILRAGYKDGVLDGPFKRWRTEDTLYRGSIVEGWYTNGMREGVWTSYYGNMQKATEGRYEKGSGKGPWSWWERDGKPVDRSKK